MSSRRIGSDKLEGHGHNSCIAEIAKPQGWGGLAVLHEHDKHDSLVVLSLADFVAWFGDPGGAV